MEAAVIEEIAASRVDKKIKLFEVIGDAGDSDNIYQVRAMLAETW